MSMKVWDEGWPVYMYIGCVYMPIDSTSVAVLDTCSERLKEDVFSFRGKGKVVLLGDFNVRVCKVANDDDVIGEFGEDTCNVSGNKLISFLDKVELVARNVRQLASELEWTRVRSVINHNYLLISYHFVRYTESR